MSDPFATSDLSNAAGLRLQPRFKSIGETAAETGLSASAIRFYERRGLVRPPRAGGRRWFGPRERARLAMIARLRTAGFALSEVALALTPSLGAQDGWRAARAGAAARLRAEITDRQAILSHLDGLAGCECHDPLECSAAAKF